MLETEGYSATDAAREALTELRSGSASEEATTETVAEPESTGSENTESRKGEGRDPKGRFAAKEKSTEAAPEATKEAAPPELQNKAVEKEAPAVAEDEGLKAIADLPTHIPQEWRNVIKANPSTKELVLKQFNEGNKIINRKTFELTNAHKHVEQYLGVLTTGLEGVVKEKYQGDRNIFAADVNRLVQALNHPQPWKRFEALKEITQAALPNGYDEESAPDPTQRALFDQIEELKRLNVRPAQQAQQPAQQEQKVDETPLIRRELDNVSRYNAEARNFINDPANASLIADKYRQLLAANPDDLGANVINAVFEAMQERAKASATAVSRDQQEAKRLKAAQLSVDGSRNSRETLSPEIMSGTDAARAAMAELRQKQRI